MATVAGVPTFSGSKMNDQPSRTQSRTHSKKITKLLTSPSIRAGTTTSTENARDRTMDSSKSTVAKSTQMPSAQALSFWSMYSSVAAHINSKRYLTVADLACAVATILTIAVLILSLKLFVDMLERDSVHGVVVTGRFGSVVGRIHKVLGHTNVYAFLAVPYAQEPVADLRFRPTRAKYDGTVKAQKSLINGMEVKPPCVQSVTDVFTTVSEDCLHLSIWTTSPQCRSPECANRPVLVFLHGGAFQEGGNSHPLHDGKYLAAYGDVVVVLPNYRLGALGYMNDGSDEAPGNAGLHDQLLALEWTRDHIDNFGGNASHLVLVGYGAGAAAAGYLLISKVAGIFEAKVVPKRAILISGSPLTRYPDNTLLISRRVKEQADRMSCVKGDLPDHTCMRAADYRLFVKTALPPVFFPSFTGLIPYPPRELMSKEERRLSGVEVLLGLMNDERTSAAEFTRMIIRDEDRFSNVTSVAPDVFYALGLNFTNFKKAERKRRKKGRHWKTPQVFYELLADFLVTCPTRELHLRLASDSSNRVSRFLVSSTSVHLEPDDMLRLVFGAPLGQPVQMKALYSASQSLISLLAYFARTGNAFLTEEHQQGKYRITVAGASDQSPEAFHARQEHCDLLKDIDI